MATDLNYKIDVLLEQLEDCIKYICSRADTQSKIYPTRVLSHFENIISQGIHYKLFLLDMKTTTEPEFIKNHDYIIGDISHIEEYIKVIMVLKN
jgi:hypothetical protein